MFKCSEVNTEEADEDSNKAKPAPWEVCETYGPAECGDNKDRCSLCKEKTSGVELCFDPKIASTLPPCEPQSCERAPPRWACPASLPAAFAPCSHRCPCPR